jgi:hypothetical protein
MKMTDLTRLADATYEGVRAINHATIGATIPAPVVYEVLGSWARLGPGLDQALGQLTEGLHRSLAAYDVYEDDGADPARAVAQAGHLLAQARAHAWAMGALLGQAQCAINRQGYRDHAEGADQ